MKQFFRLFFFSLLLGYFLMPQFLLSVSATNYTLPPIDFESADVSVEELIEQLPESASLEDPFLILINSENLIETELEVPLAYSFNGIPYHQSIDESLRQLIADASLEGLSIYVLSGYRTITQQENNRNAQYQNYIASGYSDAQAWESVNAYFAPSRGSEHSSGLAVDLLDYSWGSSLTVDFQYHAAAQWLADNAHSYGFILRYPQDKETITGINFEPWHFRYVGQEHAQFIFDYDLTLEEYIALIMEKDN